jgi:hypothetical protein
VKLYALFHRYVDFCNESAKQVANASGGIHHDMPISDLEFVHSTVLIGTDTAETAALMKNDHITVRKERSAERQRDEDCHKEHRESDKLYFEQMLSILDKPEPSRIEECMESKSFHSVSLHDRMYADVILKFPTHQDVPSHGVVIPTPCPHRSTSLRCHSFIVTKRCSWLGDKIRDARKLHAKRVERIVEDERDKVQARQSVVTIPEIQDTQESLGIESNGTRIVTFGNGPNPIDPEQRWMSHGSTEFEDGIVELNNNRSGRDVRLNQDEEKLDKSAGMVRSTAAAQIDASDDDDDDIDNFNVSNHLGPKCPSQTQSDSFKVWADGCDDEGTFFAPSSRHPTNDETTLKASVLDASPVVVHIKDHPIEAVRLLLLYCYTNRVVSLGYEAFEQSCRTKRTSSLSRRNQGHSGGASASSSLPNWPVSPYSSKSQRWPNHGEPIVPFDVAIAGMRLAEEAGLHRLTFMCEVAASQILYGSMTQYGSSLATPSSLRNSIKALEFCEEFNELHRNPLSRLRLAATHTVIYCLRKRSSNAMAVRNALSRDIGGRRLVSPLLMGIMDAIEESSSSSGSSHHKSNKRKNHALSVRLFASSSDYHRDLQCSNAEAYYARIDREDAAERDSERRKRRLASQAKAAPELDVPTSTLNLAPTNYSTTKRLRGSVTNRIFSTDEDITPENSSRILASYVGEDATKLRKSILRRDQSHQPPALLSHYQHYDSALEQQLASSTLKRLSAHYFTQQAIAGRSGASPHAAAAISSSVSGPPDEVGSSGLDEAATAARGTTMTSTTRRKSNNNHIRSSNSNNDYNPNNIDEP